MKYILKFLLKLFILLLIFSCTEAGTKSLFDIIATTNEEPGDPEKPIVKSFEVQDSIVIEWEKDKGADEYILYRAFNDPNLSYSKIYEGNKLSYTDYVGEYDIGVFFYYKIAKKRESKEFEKSDYSVGVVSDVTKGYYEDNNSIDESYNIDNLNNLLNILIYFARDEWGNEIEDRDYYKVKIPLGRYFQYQISLESRLLDNDLIVFNGENISIVDEQQFPIEYPDTGEDSPMLERYIYFAVKVDKSNFLRAGDPNFPGNTNGRGFKYGTYTMTFVRSDQIGE